MCQLQILQQYLLPFIRLQFRLKFSNSSTPRNDTHHHETPNITNLSAILPPVLQQIVHRSALKVLLAQFAAPPQEQLAIVCRRAGRRISGGRIGRTQILQRPRSHQVRRARAPTPICGSRRLWRPFAQLVVQSLQRRRLHLQRRSRRCLEEDRLLPGQHPASWYTGDCRRTEARPIQRGSHETAISSSRVVWWRVLLA